MAPKYVLDTDSLISPHRFFYPFDLAESFWKCLSERKGEIWIAPIEVYNEIMDGSEEDELKKWARENKDAFVEADEETQLILGDLLRALRGTYTDKRIRQFLRRDDGKDKADAYVIAMAKRYGAAVVTFELPKGLAKKHNQLLDTEIKIPNVCNMLNVRYINLFQMLRELGVVINFNCP